jgi:hypothetical protein
MAVFFFTVRELKCRDVPAIEKKARCRRKDGRTVGPIRLSTRAALALAIVLAGVAVVGRGVLLGKEPAADDSGLPSRVDKLVQAWQPIAGERRLDDIGWAKDIRDAFRLARANDRPIFLFTYSGSSNREHALALQRC